MQKIDILDLANRHLAGADNVYIAPHIPAKKEANARKSHGTHLSPDDPVLVLYDDTVFGSAKEGYLITAGAILWKNVMEDPRLVEWRYIDPDAVECDGKHVRLAGGQITFTQALEVAAKTAELIDAIVRSRPVPQEDDSGRCGFCDAVVVPGASRCPNCGAPI